jgi:hypothetical protein
MISPQQSRSLDKVYSFDAGSDEYIKCIAIQSSPNVDGLTASSAHAVLEGFKAEGGDVELIPFFLKYSR